MKLLGNIALFAGVFCVVSAIWVTDLLWRFLATGIICLFTGAALYGAGDKR